MAALQGLGQVEALVEVDHQLHVVADGLAHGVERGEIVAEPLAAEPQLQAGEAAFVAQLDRLGGDRGRLAAATARCCCRLAPAPTEPPSSTHSGTPAALASASQAAMSSPEAAIMDRPW